MNKFHKLVLADVTGLTTEAEKALSQYAEELVIYRDDPGNEEELLDRIREADGILLSYRTLLPESVITRCPQLRYIGLCCTIVTKESSNADIIAAEKQGITVTGVRDYGDQGVVDFVVCSLLSYLHGWGGRQWKSYKTELTDIPVGIIGLGVTGRMVADALKVFGAKVYYYSRTRKPEAEAAGITYLELPELLEKAEIISTHLPKHTCALSGEDFKKFGTGKILINTSLGPVFDVEGLKEWLHDDSNTCILDQCGMGEYREEITGANVIFTDEVCAKTRQLSERLSRKATDNLVQFLKE